MVEKSNTLGAKCSKATTKTIITLTTVWSKYFNPVVHYENKVASIRKLKQVSVNG